MSPRWSLVAGSLLDIHLISYHKIERAISLFSCDDSVWYFLLSLNHLHSIAITTFKMVKHTNSNEMKRLSLTRTDPNAGLPEDYTPTGEGPEANMSKPYIVKNKAYTTSRQRNKNLQALIAAMQAEMSHTDEALTWSRENPPEYDTTTPRRPTTHWDYLLNEMKRMSQDFRKERKWSTAVAKNIADACAAKEVDNPEDLANCRKRLNDLVRCEEDGARMMESLSKDEE